MPDAAIAPCSTTTPLLGRGLSGHAVSAFIFLAALWFVLCRHLSGEWSVNEQYNYGWFVPFFALFLFWLRWEDRPEPEIRAQRTEARTQSEESRISNFEFRMSAVAVAICCLLLLLPLRLFEIGNPDWRPLGWVHAAV